MAEDKKVVPVPAPAEDVHIDEFLGDLHEEDSTLKGMFRHFHVKVQGIEKATKAEFVKLFASFKDLPISKLK